VNVQESIAIVCLLAVGVVAFLIWDATAPKATSTHEWPANEATIFIDACERAGTNRSACQCLRTELDGEITLKSLADRRPIANHALRDAVNVCVTNRIH
jgi:hypothetical protein